MQHNKNTNKISDLEIIASDPKKLTSSLTDVMDKFNVRNNFSMFDFVKSKGLAVSSLLSVLLILPFYSVANIYALFKCGLSGHEFEGKKDAYYNIKNNENINWRRLLMFHAKRFLFLVKKNVHIVAEGTTAIVFDDTTLEKSGRKIEKISLVNDHVSGRFILGFKLLVCGFWDGASFIPLDFSIHRERGKKHQKLIKEYKKVDNLVRKQGVLVDKQSIIVENKRLQLQKAEAFMNLRPNKGNNKMYEKSSIALQKAEDKLNLYLKAQTSEQTKQTGARKKLKRFYEKGRLFGLTTKEREEQFKKPVSVKSPGFKRRKEADKDKISNLLQMLCRVVKQGIIPDYLLLDSWFFCFEILERLSKIKKGAIKLVAMVKINNQKFTICRTGKEMAVKGIIKAYEKQAQKCKKLNSVYIRVNCFYKGIRTNLFFIRMGRCKTWKLLVTTDLDISFIQLIEVYQIRWGIEVFFKESKQYLGLGASQSVNFDAQIADITIAMMQHIILSYFKRLNYQQSIGGLFKSISHEIVELDLISRLVKLFWDLLEIFCSTTGVDFMEFQEDVIRNQEFMDKMIKLVPEKILEKAA
jgi:hypothetical protein